MVKEKKALRPEEVRARLKELVQKTLQEALEAELERRWVVRDRGCYRGLLS